MTGKDAFWMFVVGGIGNLFGIWAWEYYKRNYR